MFCKMAETQTLTRHISYDCREQSQNVISGLLRPASHPGHTSLSPPARKDDFLRLYDRQSQCLDVSSISSPLTLLLKQIERTTLNKEQYRTVILPKLREIDKHISLIKFTSKSQANQNLDRDLDLESKIKEIFYLYKNGNSKLFFKVNAVLKSKTEALRSVASAGKNFQKLLGVTSITNLFSWITDVCWQTVLLGYTERSRNFFIISTITGAVAVCGSLFTLSHVKHKIQEIAKNLRQCRYDFLELESIFRKGNHLDDAVNKLFPYEIDVNLIDPSLLRGDKDFENEKIKKQYLLSVIAWSNIIKDETLLKDENFLMSVNLFVESPASNIWWKRMQIRKLMEDITSMDKIGSDLISISEVFQNRAASAMLPVTIPLIFSSRFPSSTRLFLGAMGTTFAVMDLASTKQHEFDDLETIKKMLKKEWRAIKKMWTVMNSNYE